MPKFRNTLFIDVCNVGRCLRHYPPNAAKWIVPKTAELMDRTCLKAIAKNRKFDFPETVQACIVTEVDGSEEYEIKKQAEQIEKIANVNGVVEIRIA